MKKFIFILMAICAVIPIRAEPLDTYHSSWHLVRETADEDGDTLAAVYNLTTESDFAHKDSNTVANGGPFRIRSLADPDSEGYSPGGAWMFAFCAKNYYVGSDNDVNNVFSFNIVGWAKTNGMLQNICEGNVILGTQAVITYPDGGDAVGSDVTVTDANYTYSTETFTVTDGSFDGMAAGMVAYVNSPNSVVTSGFYAITTYTDVNTIVMSGISSSENILTSNVTIQVNPAFWVDTITLDETTKWPSVAVLNSADNEMAFVAADLTGLEWIQVVVYDADAATGIQAGDVTVYGRRY